MLAQGEIGGANNNNSTEGKGVGLKRESGLAARIVARSIFPPFPGGKTPRNDLSQADSGAFIFMTSPTKED